MFLYFMLCSTFLIYNYIILYWVYVIYPRGGSGVPFPHLFPLVAPSCALSGHVWASRCFLVISCRYLCQLRPSAMGWIRGRVGVRVSLGLRIFWRFYLNRLILAPSSHCGRWTLILCSGTLDPRMHLCRTHQSDGDPTLDVSTRPRVGLPPLCWKVTGYLFQDIRRLHAQQPANGGNKGREVSALLESCLQVHLLLLPLRSLRTLLRCLCQMGIFLLFTLLSGKIISLLLSTNIIIN